MKLIVKGALKLANPFDSIIGSINKLTDKIANPKENGLWSKLAAMNKAIADKMFNKGGGQYGRKKWPDLDPKMDGRKRYGSDGSSQGRYNGSSIPLVASGKYKGSHRVLESTGDTMRFGSSFSDRKVAYLTNAGRGDRVVIPDSESFEYIQDVERVTSKHMNKIITEAFNDSI